ncbi:hypothetical protein AKJ09_06955 [Labilithrix luteola]|uniref:Uncharacterized protein n=1 Tax=Labilithrix luteola TaxID=1391654 RepID=A0A0K1Q3T0_9BACT|nr:DUF1826 domain-containing protein [Labilithrix luteola]AKV00292.1 hypothetical protein AKJ09_06955 [Labilithrix luteola]
MKRWEPSARLALSAGWESRPREVGSTLWTDDPVDADALEEPHLNAVVVRRQGHEALAAYARTISEKVPFQAEALVSCGEPNGFDGLDAFAAELPPDDARDVLLSDIAFWCEVVSYLSGAPEVVVRLNRLASPVFPGFLVDPGTVRLVCTYAGPSSQWLEERDVDRALLGPRGLVPPEVIRLGAVVQCCSPLDVVLLKGRMWPLSSGVVYRAPAPSAPRLLLSIEPAYRHEGYS